MSKQPLNKAQLAKLKEESVVSKPIAELFGRKSPKRRAGRPNKKSSSNNKEEEEISEEPMTKIQRGGRKYSNSTANSKLSKSSKSLETSKSKSSKAKTKRKSNTSLSYAYKKNEKKKKRGKWSAEYLRKVQVCWDDKTDLAIDENEDPITDLKEYAVIVGMGSPTFYTYFRANKSKRQSIGNGVGPNRRLLTDGDINFIADVLVRSDRGNNGTSRLEAMDYIQEVNPTLDRKQAKDLLERRVLPKAYSYGKIKRKTLKAQATTTERTAITYRSQWRWYSFVTSMLNDLRRKNGGLCKNNGKTFGDLIQYFVLGLDEACIMEDAGGKFQNYWSCR